MLPKSSYKRGTAGARVGKDTSTSRHEAADCAEWLRPRGAKVGRGRGKGLQEESHTPAPFQISGAQSRDCEGVEENISEYEAWRNERVAFNQKKLQELLPSLREHHGNDKLNNVVSVGGDNNKGQHVKRKYNTAVPQGCGHSNKRQQKQSKHVIAVPQASQHNSKRQQKELNHDTNVLEAAVVGGDISMRQQEIPQYVTAFQQGLEVGRNCDEGEKGSSCNTLFGKKVAGCFSQDDLYHRIFHQKPRGAEGKIPWGRVFLRENFQQQWKVYNQNIKLVRSWFSDPDDKFVKSNLRNCKETVAAVKEFIRIREPSLAALLFISDGLVLHMRWQVDDIYEWFKNHKHYCCRKSRNVPSASQVEEVGELDFSKKSFSKDDCYNQQSIGMEVCAAEEFETQEFRIVKNQEKGHKKRRRVPSSKAMEQISLSLGKKQKKKTSGQQDVEDRLLEVLKDANLGVYQGLQLEALTECSKKTVAMVVMNVERTFDVFPNLSLFVSETLPEFDIKLKKDDPRQSKIHGLLLDVVVWWALKEFKVGILSPPPLRNGLQQLFLENIKKLF